jgi:putative ABC transport system ATP-binding protein
MLIKTQNLTKIYTTGETEVRALDDVSLSISRGEFVSIVGTSGSGKSTLLHLLGGLDIPTSGKVFIDGTDIYDLAPDPLTVFRRRCIGFVFQRYNLIPNLNVWENITLPLGLDGMDADPNEVDELLHTLGIEDKKNAMPSQLSGGQQQRVAIARALITKPHIILADEPTGNLDSRTGREVLGLLQNASRQYGQSIAMVTHDPIAASFADRVIFLGDGRVVEDRARMEAAEIGAFMLAMEVPA